MKNNKVDQIIDQNTNKTKINSEENFAITHSRVLSIRYKIYTIIVLLILAYGGYNYLYPTYMSYIDKKIDLQNVESQILSFETRKKKIEQDKKLIDAINKQSSKIIKYFNEKGTIKTLDGIIKNNTGIVKDYLQLNTLFNPKMIVDERIILANINEFLLRNENKKKNGFINSIEIGEPEVYYKNLYHLPIQINVTFDDKNGLLSFINNLENSILPDPKYRILYKIDEIVYDIVNYRQKQDVKIALSIFYYR